MLGVRHVPPVARINWADAAEPTPFVNGGTEVADFIRAGFAATPAATSMSAAVTSMGDIDLDESACGIAGPARLGPSRSARTRLRRKIGATGRTSLPTNAGAAGPQPEAGRDGRTRLRAGRTRLGSRG